MVYFKFVGQPALTMLQYHYYSVNGVSTIFLALMIFFAISVKPVLIGCTAQVQNIRSYNYITYLSISKQFNLKYILNL